MNQFVGPILVCNVAESGTFAVLFVVNYKVLAGEKDPLLIYQNVIYKEMINYT